MRFLVRLWVLYYGRRRLRNASFHCLFLVYEWFETLFNVLICRKFLSIDMDSGMHVFHVPIAFILRCEAESRLRTTLVGTQKWALMFLYMAIAFIGRGKAIGE
jgi:hypothetical protein